MNWMRLVLFSGVASAGLSASLAGEASATDTFIYIHGWTKEGTDFSSCNGQTRCPAYWSEQLNVNSRHVGWNTSVDWRETEHAAKVGNLFHQYCRTDQGHRCRIVCHSTGCALGGKVLSWYSAHNTPWTIQRMVSLGSAEGGTEAAFLAKWFGSNRSGEHLTPDKVRGEYNHNVSAGAPVFHVAGNVCTELEELALAGACDGTVPFHSACGSAVKDNPTKCYGEGAKWAMHSTSSYCGVDGCNVNHSQLKRNEYQFSVMTTTP
jgi:hypothetical protein